MAPRVLIVGFDALETTLVDRWADEGLLPSFAALSANGITYPLENDVEYLPDTLWTDVISGRSSAAAGLYWQPEQVHVGEARLRPNSLDDFRLTPFWQHASDAGRRVAVIDAAYAPPASDLNGVLLRDWGAHSAGFGRGSDPPGYLDEIVARYGDYPLPHGHSRAEGRAWGCDVHDGSRAALEDLPQRLAEAVALKTRVVLGELERQDSDLVFAVFHEGHCAGHQLWHFMDETSPWYEPDAPDSLKNGVRSVYARLDRSLGEILERVESDTHVFVVLTRGMRSHVGGWQLLTEILVRLGYTGAGAVAGSVRSRLPAPMRRTIKAVIRGPLRERLKSASGTSVHPLENPRTRALSVRCGGNGAIRLNVRGREPFGSIEPGHEYDEACAELTRELEALQDADTGEPVVEDVSRADFVFGERYHPNLPDLIVQFRQQGAISSVRSPRIGTVSEPARDRRFARSGEHTPHVRLWHYGPGVGNWETVPGGHAIDVAPTVLELLSVPLAAELEGGPLPRRAALRA
jgi:predicted AlkP superfamily phosphohydrolase/phosphomutase